jgi:hypothetical protein
MSTGLQHLVVQRQVTVLSDQVLMELELELGPEMTLVV